MNESEPNNPDRNDGQTDPCAAVTQKVITTIQGWRGHGSLLPVSANGWLRDRLANFPAVMLMTGIAVPIMALIATVFALATRIRGPLTWATDGGPHTWVTENAHWQPAAALVNGITAAVLLWLLLSLVYVLTGFTSLTHANRGVYIEFLRQFADAVGTLETAATCAEPSQDGCAAMLTALHGLEGIRESARLSNSPQWVLCYGYTDLWRRLHDTEDALAALNTPQQSIQDGLDDLRSLRNSNIDNADVLLAQTRHALLTIDPTTEQYLDQPVAKQGGQGNVAPPPVALSNAVPPSTPTPLTGAAPGAQATIRGITQTIVSYRDDQWDGLVRARSRMYGTTTYVGVGALVLLAAAILFGASSMQIEAAAVFYLVGVVFGGLFQRLTADGTANSAVEDYGFSALQLVQISLVSGLAALAGVVLTGIAPVPASSGTLTISSVAGIFTFDRFGEFFLVSAVFGLTPGLVLGRLNQQAQQYTSDISTSKAATSK